MLVYPFQLPYIVIFTHYIHTSFPFLHQSRTITLVHVLVRPTCHFKPCTFMLTLIRSCTFAFVIHIVPGRRLRRFLPFTGIYIHTCRIHIHHFHHTHKDGRTESELGGGGCGRIRIVTARQGAPFSCFTLVPPACAVFKATAGPSEVAPFTRGPRPRGATERWRTTSRSGAGSPSHLGGSSCAAPPPVRAPHPSASLSWVALFHRWPPAVGRPGPHPYGATGPGRTPQTVHQGPRGSTSSSAPLPHPPGWRCWRLVPAIAAAVVGARTGPAPRSGGGPAE